MSYNVKNDKKYIHMYIVIYKDISFMVEFSFFIMQSKKKISTIVFFGSVRSIS